MDMRERAIARGLKTGRKIRYRKPRGSGEDRDTVKFGVVEGIYPFVFTVRMEEGYLVSFQYQELIEEEGRVQIV